MSSQMWLRDLSRLACPPRDGEVGNSWEGLCGRRLLKWLLGITTSWYPHLCVIPVSVDWIYWSFLLMNGLCPKKVTKDGTSILLKLFLSGSSCLFHSDKASCHVVPYGKVHASRNGGRCLVKCQQGTEPCQQPREGAWKHILSQSRLEMIAATAAILIVVLWGTQGQRYPAVLRFLTRRNCKTTDDVLNR